MSRFLGLLLTPLLVLPACESEPDATTDVATLVDATADVAVFLCECSLEAEGKDPQACAEAAEDVLGSDVNDCIEDVVAMDPGSREVMRCSTAALRDLLNCYESAGMCPETGGSDGSASDEDPVEEEDEPISEDACGLAFEDDIEACGDLPADTQEALDACLPGDEAEAENCPGDDC